MRLSGGVITVCYGRNVPVAAGRAFTVNACCKLFAVIQKKHIDSMCVVGDCIIGDKRI
jgi:GH24 family phage-related lysozyme (muramidase)